jgi:hypothetical protein
MPTVRLDNIRSVRKALGVSQSKAATLLGVSTKAIQSYEQGARSTPPYVQRTAALLLYTQWRKKHPSHPPCWQVTRCLQEVRAGCPAFRHQAGDLCWMLTGTNCRGNKEKTPAAKLARCQKCPVMGRWLTY